MDHDPEDVDAYITGFPPATQAQLQVVRHLIHEVAPEAVESMSYGLPTFSVGGRYLVYIGGWKRHVSLYPVPEADPDLGRDMEPYRSGKGTLRFPVEAPIPDELVRRIVAALLAQRGAGQRS